MISCHWPYQISYVHYFVSVFRFFITNHTKLVVLACKESRTLELMSFESDVLAKGKSENSSHLNKNANKNS